MSWQDGLTYHTKLNNRQVKDEIGSITATEKNGPPEIVTGQREGAIDFTTNGNKGYYELSSSPISNDTTVPWTVSIWIYHLGGNPEKVISWGANPGFQFGYNSNDDYLFYLEDNNSNAIAEITDNDPPRNQWVHVVGTYDGSQQNDGISIFVDGQAVSTSSLFTQTLDKPIGTTSPFFIGARGGGSPDDQHWNGYADNFYVWDGRVLSLNEIQALNRYEKRIRQA